MKYKVGDMVRVKTWDELIEEGYKLNAYGAIDVGEDHFNEAMIPFGGKVCTVYNVVDPFYFLNDSDGAFWCRFTEGMLSPATEENSGQSTERVENNAVEHPNHYTAGGIECIDAIRASLGNKEFADYCKGNVLKYIWRYRLKNGVEDLKKAQVYLCWMIEAEEA